MSTTMSTTLTHVSLLTPSAAPQNARGARVAAALFAALLNGVAGLFKAPAARAPSRAEEAAPVREMAWRVRKTDPGFSADLYAAAARHEGHGD